MRKIKLYIATSIDGFIAQSDGDLDWLIEYPNPEKTDYGCKNLFESIDTVIIGNRAYYSILSMDVKWPYQGKKCYIISHNADNSEHDIEYITKDVIEQISNLKMKTGKDIWLVGGGELVSMLLNHNLIDEMIMNCIPVILGHGIPLFPNMPKASNWQTVDSVRYKNGVVQTTYRLNI
jgi:dihydrofolate reductase